MRIKKLFNTEAEFLDYAWSFINFDENKVWREEDLPKLQPFFDYNKVRPERLMTPEEREGFDHYEKCRKEYADALFEVRESISQFGVSELSEFFLLEFIDMDCYDCDEEGNEIDEEGNIIPPLSRDTIKLSPDWEDEISFPLYFVGFIDSGWDRMGNIRMCYSEFVTLKEFKIDKET